MNLTDVRHALAAWVAWAAAIDPAYATPAPIAGREPSGVFWKGRPRGWTGPRYAILRLGGVRTQGRDEIVWDFDGSRPAGAELAPHQVGLRNAVLSVQIHSHLATDTEDALAATCAVRDRLHLPASTEAFAAVSLMVADVPLAPTDLSEIVDQREMSAAEMQIRFNTHSDVAGTATTYVEHYGAEGKVADASGTERTVINRLIPP